MTVAQVYLLSEECNFPDSLHLACARESDFLSAKRWSASIYGTTTMCLEHLQTTALDALKLCPLLSIPQQFVYHPAATLAIS